MFLLDFVVVFLHIFTFIVRYFFGNRVINDIIYCYRKLNRLPCKIFFIIITRESTVYRLFLSFFHANDTIFKVVNILSFANPHIRILRTGAIDFFSIFFAGKVNIYDIAALYGTFTWNLILCRIIKHRAINIIDLRLYIYRQAFVFAKRNIPCFLIIKNLTIRKIVTFIRIGHRFVTAAGFIFLIKEYTQCCNDRNGCHCTYPYDNSYFFVHRSIPFWLSLNFVTILTYKCEKKKKKLGGGKNPFPVPFFSITPAQ